MWRNGSPPESPSPEARALVLAKAYASAYEAKDADAYLSLFSRDADYFDFAVQIYAKIRSLKEELRRSFQRDDFRLSVHSIFVSSDGAFAALRGTYTDTTRSELQVSVPVVSILEIQNGKIQREFLYYDGSLFKRHFHAA